MHATVPDCSENRDAPVATKNYRTADGSYQVIEKACHRAYQKLLRSFVGRISASGQEAQTY